MNTETKDTQKHHNKRKHTIITATCFVIIMVLILTLVGCNELLLKKNKVEAKNTVLTSEEVDNLVRNASNEIAGDLSTYINNYFTENNITGELSTEDINQIAEVITNGIIENYSLTDEEVTNIKHEILNQLLQNFQVSQDTNVSYLTEEVKNYVQETSVKNILNSIEIKNNTITGSDNSEAITNLVEKTDTTDSTLSDTIERLSGTNEDLESTKDDLAATKENLTSATEDLQSRSDSLDEKINTAQGTCDSLQERLNELTGQLADMDSLNQSDINKILQQIVQLQTDIQNASDELESLQQEKEQLATDIADNKNAIETVNVNVTDANTNIAFNSSLINNLNDEKVSISDLDKYMLEMCYPVGSIYMSEKNVSPASFLGGTWEAITDTTLVGAGNTYAAGSTGGSSSVTLSAENIPSLAITGSTNEQNNISTSDNGYYSSTINSQGTYTGGTYNTSANGEHTHAFSTGGTALVVDSIISNPAMAYGYGYSNATNGAPGTIWFDNHTKNNSEIASAGNHNHSVTIPSQTINSAGTFAVPNHSHTLNIPSLYVDAAYINDSVSGISVQDPYTAVYMWKRVS